MRPQPQLFDFFVSVRGKGVDIVGDEPADKFLIELLVDFSVYTFARCVA